MMDDDVDTSCRCDSLCGWRYAETPTVIGI